MQTARTKLKLFRVERRLSQEQISEKIGCKRATYSAVENGTRNGRPMFWNSLQNAFALSDEAVEMLKTNDE